MLARTPEAPAEQGQPATADPVKAAREWFDRAQQAYLAKNFIQAAECFRNAFAHLPDKPDLIYNEGAALEMARHFPAAANAYEHYLFLLPGAPEVRATGAKGGDELNERGLLAMKLGDHACAYDCFVKSYDLAPDEAALDRLG